MSKRNQIVIGQAAGSFAALTILAFAGMLVGIGSLIDSMLSLSANVRHSAVLIVGGVVVLCIAIALLARRENRRLEKIGREIAHRAGLLVAILSMLMLTGCLETLTGGAGGSSSPLDALKQSGALKGVSALSGIVNSLPDDQLAMWQSADNAALATKGISPEIANVFREMIGIRIAGANNAKAETVTIPITTTYMLTVKLTNGTFISEGEVASVFVEQRKAYTLPDLAQPAPVGYSPSDFKAMVLGKSVEPSITNAPVLDGPSKTLDELLAEEAAKIAAGEAVPR